MELNVPIKKDSNKIKEAKYILIFFFFWGKRKIIQSKIKKVDKTTNGMERPSTPKENFKLSLLNHPNELTNWKWGILLSKFNGR